MGKIYLNGIPYSTEITESRFNYDLLLENTNFTPTTGTESVTRTYTLNNPIDDYDAVMVFGYLYCVSTNKNQIMSMTIMNKDYYTTSASIDTFLLNGTIDTDISKTQTRRLMFKFPDSTHISTATGMRLDTEEPRLWKVYGLKFPNDDAITSQVMHVKGNLIYDANNHISGIGCATITLNNGVATIDFALQITGSSASADEFDWGISRDLLKALSPAVPDITPVSGGFWDFYGYNDTRMQIAPVFQASGNLWKFGRYYENTMSSIGVWVSRMFSNGNHLHGVIYGTYNTRTH